MIGHVAGPGLVCIYINFVSLLGFPYSYDRLHVGHVMGYVTWPMYISLAFSFGSSYSLFFFFLSLICSSSGMPAIASSYLMCGFLNRAVPLHIVTISFSDTLNTVNGFWRFLALFTNVINGAAINSFIFNNTGIVFIEIVKP